MKNELQLFNFDGQQVRTVMINDEPYFVGKDVAEILGYANTRDALSKHVDGEDKIDGVAIRDSIGREQKPVVINESGLYSLIIGSKLPDAKKFKRWVTKEVLPSIRKTGAYQARPLTIQEQIRVIAQGSDEMNKRLENIEQRMGLPGNMAHEFTQRRNKKIVQVLGGKDSNAYQNKQLRSRTYRAMFAAYKSVFMQDRYNDVPMKRFDEVVEFVDNWFPPYELQSEIQSANTQGNLFME